jgi:hypothetical protein
MTVLKQVNDVICNVVAINDGLLLRNKQVKNHLRNLINCCKIRVM